MSRLREEPTTGGPVPNHASSKISKVLVANRGDWKVKGTGVASDMLRVYFADKGRKGVTDPTGTLAKKPRSE